MFLGKRERLLKTAWRHGITGIDDADSRNTSNFYRTQRDLNDYRQMQQEKVLALRKECKFCLTNLIQA
jgi:predicted amidohydrolase YtcJ